MGNRLVLAGNIAAIVTVMTAFLQFLPWPSAGLLTLALLTVPILLRFAGPIGRTGRVGRTADSKPLQKPATEPVALPSRSILVEPKLEPTEERKGMPRKTQPPSPAPIQPAPKPKPDGSPARIGKGDYLSFDLNLEAGKKVAGEVSASGSVNVYVLTPENLDALDLGQEFWYETGSEGVEKASLGFKAPEKGKWFFVVENSDDGDIDVTVKISVS